MGFITTNERIREIEKWNESGKEHDFHEINLASKLEKSKKIEDFRNNHLPKLRDVVKNVVEFNTNSWLIETHNGQHFKYYSTKGKLFKSGSNNLYRIVNYKGIHKFFDKPYYK